MKSSLFALPVLALVVAAIGFTTPTAAGGFKRLASKTVLDAAQEVDPPGSDSAGLSNAIISFKRSFREAHIRVTFSNLQGEVTRLHLHCAPQGQNGPVAIGFIDLEDVRFDNSETVTLGANSIIGSVDKRQFPAGDANNCGIYSLRSLAEAINEGGIYWNLHTTEFPGGELRGQLEPLEFDYYKFDD